MQLTASKANGFVYSLRKVTEEAARAAYEWSGRGAKEEGDAAAVAAMRTMLNELSINGEVVIGEGEKDKAPLLYNGERFGDLSKPPELDIAVDPVEGTSYLAHGLTNAMAVIGIAPRGAMFNPGPAFYMEKFAAPPAAKGKIDPSWPLEKKLQVLGDVLCKRMDELTVFVLEKPRHRDLVARLHRAGVRVALYPAGDVAGAILAAMPDSKIDALVGTGGTPEGVLSACAIRPLGGVLYGRLDPQLQTEAHAVRQAGLDTTKWYSVEELVQSDDVYFCATGITNGLLFDGVERTAAWDRVQTLMITGATRERQLLTTYRPH